MSSYSDLLRCNLLESAMSVNTTAYDTILNGGTVSTVTFIWMHKKIWF